MFKPIEFSDPPKLHWYKSSIFMIVSNDSIMNPPFEISNEILRLIVAVSEKIGPIHAHHLKRPSPELRKRNRAKTIKASLEIEGNTLSEDQVTAIMENKRSWNIEICD